MTREGWIRLVVVAAAVAALEIACRTGWIPTTVVIPPSAMATSLYDILVSGTHWGDILVSLRSVAAAGVLAIGLGFLVGAVIHALPPVRSAAEPLLASYYAVPTFMFYPVFIILFGVGSAAIVAIAVLLAIVAMISATLIGLDRIPRVLGKTALIMRMGPVERAFRISLPAAMPYLFTGVKLAVAYAFIGVIASEFILSGAGMGYAIAYAYNNFNNREMYGLMLLIVVLVTIVNTALDAVDRRLQARLRR
ncbi:ABC transporter permease subunit [Rhodoplanes sp. TEM]|uniref:ABC transporter permease subunit n=1 Tax=Rhodoplanes tepidamans TaxID=200616 RepID=A0ABT5JF59_RHOTP|nr:MULTISPECIES: ABC transporter permease subunit [Rhodoplanes]MDC7788350.1 ABC transporter permease subunit [Rhodoplanes tepidamans]MDC7986092.1 ABC transporter permease subunit [Rhodoplanes sp. TEM]MDQ0358831.1 NitT/TauT family transport system permease protein [Rhodoplanes tepidamans]